MRLYRRHRRVITSNNAKPQPKMRWQRSTNVLPILPMNEGPALHTLANLFKFLEDAKQRGDQGEINECKIYLLRLIATYDLRSVADRFHLQPLLRLIDDLKRDPPPNFIKLGRKSRTAPADAIDIICRALFMLNPLAMPLTQLYELIFPFGTSKLANFKPPAFTTLNQRRYGLLAHNERLLMMRSDNQIVRVSARAFGDYAAHIHPDLGKQYCQLASCRQEIWESLLYAFHAQAWAMRTYAQILKEHGRTSCPFLTNVLEKTPMGVPSTGQLLLKNDGLHGSMRPYILCYKKLQEKITQAHDRSRPAFVLPYFGRDHYNELVMYKVHLHHAAYRSNSDGKGRKFTRIIDVYRILSAELQSEYGIDHLDKFAALHGLEPINLSRVPSEDEAYVEWIEKKERGEDTNPNTP